MLQEALCLVAVTPQLFRFMMSRFLQGADVVHGEIDSYHSCKENSANTPLNELPMSSMLGLVASAGLSIRMCTP